MPRLWAAVPLKLSVVSSPSSASSSSPSPSSLLPLLSLFFLRHLQNRKKKKNKTTQTKQISKALSSTLLRRRVQWTLQLLQHISHVVLRYLLEFNLQNSSGRSSSKDATQFSVQKSSQRPHNMLEESVIAIVPIVSSMCFYGIFMAPQLTVI